MNMTMEKRNMSIEKNDSTWNKTMINKVHSAMISLYAGDCKRIQHFCKVHSYAKLIGELEQIDNDTLYILEIAALTHDIGIHISEEKYGNCNGKHQEEEGPTLAKKLLYDLGIDEKVSERVQYLIGHHHTYTNVDGIDYQILIEADFLVNFFEDEVPEDGIREAYRHIFKTETGRKICREMFGITGE
jgi:predicted metal-dependent HD superfamily phosphohydrolase